MKAFAVAVLLVAIAACGVTLQETEATIYAAADQACVAQASDYDSGVACVHTVQRVFCGPGGVYVEAGVCPDGGAK